MDYKSVCSLCGTMSELPAKDDRNRIIEMFRPCQNCHAFEAMRPLEDYSQENKLYDFAVNVGHLPNIHELPKPAGPSVASAYNPMSLEQHADKSDMAIMRANFAAQFMAAAVSRDEAEPSAAWAVAQADALLKELCK